MAMPRAWPSFSVALASLFTKVASTAASSGRKLLEDAHQPVVDGEKPRRERVPIVGRHRAAAEKAEPVAGNLDDAPAGAAEPRIDPENANRAGHAGVVHSTLGWDAGFLRYALIASDQRVGNLEIGIDVLDVVVLVEVLDEL